MDPIKTKSQYEQALLTLQELSQKNELPELYEKLSTAILDYERQAYPLPPLDPVQVIQVRMAHLKLDKKDLFGLVGSKTSVGDALAHRRPLSKKLSRGFATALDLDPGLLEYPKKPEVKTPAKALGKRPTPNQQNEKKAEPQPISIAPDRRWANLAPRDSKNPDAVELILQVMEEKNIQRRDLVPKVLDSGALSELLNKRRPISQAIMEKLAQALGIPIERLDTQYPPDLPTDPGNLQSRLKIVELVRLQARNKKVKRPAMRALFGSDVQLENFLSGRMRLNDEMVGKLAKFLQLNPDRLREKN